MLEFDKVTTDKKNLILNYWLINYVPVAVKGEIDNGQGTFRRYLETGLR